MKNLYRLLILVFFIFLGVAHISEAQTSISVDQIDGYYDGKLKSDVPIRYHIRATNNSGFNISSGAIAFRLFITGNGEIPDGEFAPMVFDTLPVGLSDLFDLHFQVVQFSVDGIGSDTSGFQGSRLFNTGFVDGFNEIIATISTSVSSDYAGDSLCLDSSYFPPSGTWLWSSGGGGNFTPDWSGPHCYEILPSCCTDVRGNVDYSEDDVITVADVVYLVDYMHFDGDAPICPVEADVNGDGNQDIADLVYLVNYNFLMGTAPVTCP